MQHRWIVSVAAAALMAAHAQAHDLKVSLASKGTMATAAQEAVVTLQYTNTGHNTLYVYKWALPGKELRDPLFDVMRDGKAVSYVGPLVKRRAPTAQDVIAIAPGKSVSAEVKVSPVYNMTTSGTYSIRYKMDADSVVVNATRSAPSETAMAVGTVANQSESLESGEVSMFVEGRNNALMERAQSAQWLAHVMQSVMAASISYTGCSSSQQSAIATAVPNGATYATNAYNYLNNTTPSGTARYTTWFGKYSSTNWSKVKTHYSNIKSTLSSKALSFDCTCTEADTYAYVYPDQPYGYHLCGAFWSAPATGTDSKAGTLVHESSHFTVNGGTQDYAYGQTAAKSLAKKTPSKAVMNADSHEYFAENNPAQN